ncbi:MAG: enoyl-CoA hydratase [Pseudomonadota bacterium]
MEEIFKADNSNDAPLVLAKGEGAVLRLEMNRPPANALSIAMMEALKGEIEKAAADEDVRVIILASSNPGKLFCAGHDLKEMTAHRSDADEGATFYEQTFKLCANLMLAIVECPKPVIAEVDGLATAAGCQLVATCDLAICTDTSAFCTPGVNIGLFCSTPMVALTRNVHRKQAMEMLLTGETIDASTAKEFGLVNRIVPRQYLNQVMDKYAQTIASKPKSTLTIGKRAFYDRADMSLRDAYDHTAKVMVQNMLGGESKEGIGAFLEKRMPDWGNTQ